MHLIMPRMELAIEEYKKELEKKGEGVASIRGVSKEFGVAWTTIRDRINHGAVLIEKYAKVQQRFKP